MSFNPTYHLWRRRVTSVKSIVYDLLLLVCWPILLPYRAMRWFFRQDGADIFGILFLGFIGSVITLFIGALVMEGISGRPATREEIQETRGISYCTAKYVKDMATSNKDVPVTLKQLHTAKRECAEMYERLAAQKEQAEALK